MPLIRLYLDKSIEQNASLYYEESKKIKRKIEGAKEAIKRAEEKLIELEKKEKTFQNEITKKELQNIEKKSRKTEWYEKFRWFFSSEGFLCIGGRDATTNEIIIKKHTEKDDIVFHTDMAGSPFFVVKTERKKPSEKTLGEVAQATASYSRAWKLGLSTSDVFYVKPEQVSKEANPGEYMGKGSFMIRGKTTYIRPDMKIAIGIKDNNIIGGPVESIKANADKYFVIVQGNEKSSDIAKKIRKLLGAGDLDEIIRFLPNGGVKLG